jgi:hypothetical protein
LEVRAGLDGTQTLRETSEARALAESGIWGTLALLLDDARIAEVRLDGTRQTLPFSGEAVSVAVEDEAGKLDLNAVPEPMLRTLFAVVGLENPTALAGAVAGRHYTSIEELRLVPGLTPAALQRLRPFVTVSTGDWAINPLNAQREVLATLMGGDLHAADGYLALRARDAADPVALRLASPPEIKQVAVWSPPRIVTVRATATLTTGASYTRAATFDLAPPDRQQPFRILSWAPIR